MQSPSKRDMSSSERFFVVFFSKCQSGRGQSLSTLATVVAAGQMSNCNRVHLFFYLLPDSNDDAEGLGTTI
jgi:hypothetical protein